MATETTVKAPQTAAFTDGTLTVAPGDTVFLSTDDAGGIPGNTAVDFYYDTATLDQIAFSLTGNNRIEGISGYANLIAKKGVTAVKVGVGKFSA